VAPAAGVAGIRGRAAAAVGLTLRDVAESSLIDPFTGDDSRVEGGGLRAGSYSLALDGLLELRGTSYVSGVRIDGTVTRFGERRQSGKVRIDGPEGIDGVVRLRGRRFSGRVAGRQVSGVFRRSPASPARAATVRPHPVALPR